MILPFLSGTVIVIFCSGISLILLVALTGFFFGAILGVGSGNNSLSFAARATLCAHP